jgi:glycosyltransferase involved in cell wall biosynthesis
MPFHIATSIVFDFDLFAERAAADQGPRHNLYQLSQQLNAQIHQPNSDAIQPIDRVLAKICSQPQHWALARQLITQLHPGDTVYCPGEDMGFPLALLALRSSHKPHLIIGVMAPERPRCRLLMRFLEPWQGRHVYVTNVQTKADYIKSLLNIGDDRVAVLREKTDAQFFRPSPSSKEALARPIIASAGLEQRDYVTLAAATQDLPVDVRVCAVSPNHSDQQRTAIPPQLPTNMEMRYYDWVELRQLYQQCSITVISLLQNHYSAGLTVLMEAMACARPVIMTRTPGLAETMIDKGLVLGVRAGDAAELRQGIQQLLTQPEAAEEMAQAAHQYFLAHHRSDLHVEDLAVLMQRGASGPNVTTPEPNMISSS